MKKETYLIFTKASELIDLAHIFETWEKEKDHKGNHIVTIKDIYGKEKIVSVNRGFFKDFCFNATELVISGMNVYDQAMPILKMQNGKRAILDLKDITNFAKIISSTKFYKNNPIFKSNLSQYYLEKNKPVYELFQDDMQEIYTAVSTYVNNMETADDLHFAAPDLFNALKIFKSVFSDDQMINITARLFDINPAEFQIDMLSYIDFKKVTDNKIKNDFLIKTFEYYAFKDASLTPKESKLFFDSFDDENVLSNTAIQTLINNYFLKNGFLAIVRNSDSEFVKKHFEEIFKNYIMHTEDFSNDIDILSGCKITINYLDDFVKERFTNLLIKNFEENRLNFKVFRNISISTPNFLDINIKFKNDATNLQIKGNYGAFEVLKLIEHFKEPEKSKKIIAYNNLLYTNFYGSYYESLVSKKILNNYISKKLFEHNFTLKEILDMPSAEFKNIDFNAYYKNYLESSTSKIIKNFDLDKTNIFLGKFLGNCSQESFTLLSEKLLAELKARSNKNAVINFLDQTAEFKAHKELKAFFEEELAKNQAIDTFASKLKPKTKTAIQSKNWFFKLNWKNIINKYIDSKKTLESSELSSLFNILKNNYIPGLDNKTFLSKVFEKLIEQDASIETFINFNYSINDNLLPELKEVIKEKLFDMTLNDYQKLKEQNVSRIISFINKEITKEEEKFKYFEKFFKDENTVNYSKKYAIETILDYLIENTNIKYDVMTVVDGINFHNKYFFKFFANNLNAFIGSGKANEKNYVPVIDVDTHQNIISNSFGVAHIYQNERGGVASQYDASTTFDYKLLNIKHIANSQDFKDYYIRKTLNLLIPVFNTKEDILFKIADSDKLITITNNKENLIPQKRINAKEEDKAIISNKNGTLFVQIYPYTAGIKKPGIALFERAELNKCKNKSLEILANHYIDITENFLERMQYENEQNKYKEKISEIMATLDYFADEVSNLKTEILADGFDENTVFIPYIDKINTKIENVANYILNGKSFDNKISIKLENVLNDSIPIIKKAVNDYTLFISTKNENVTSDLQDEMNQLLKTFVRYSESVIIKIDDILNNDLEWSVRDTNASMIVRTVGKEDSFPKLKIEKPASKSSSGFVFVDTKDKDLNSLEQLIEKEKQTNLCIQKLARIITAKEEEKSVLRKELYKEFSEDILNSITSKMIMDYLEVKQEKEFTKINNDLNKE